MSTPYNRAAAFTAFCRGEELEAISLALAIPLDTLKDWARSEGWRRLAVELQPNSMPTMPEAKAEKDIVKIQANRDKNLAIADQLREVLARTVTKLHQGSMKIRRMTSKGQMVELEPTFKDLRDLAAFAKDVAELGYRALGDQPQPQREGEGAGAVAGGGQITIVLPGPVALPRQERAIDVETVPQIPAILQPEAQGALAHTDVSS